LVISIGWIATTPGTAASLGSAWTGIDPSTRPASPDFATRALSSTARAWVVSPCTVANTATGAVSPFLTFASSLGSSFDRTASVADCTCIAPGPWPGGGSFLAAACTGADKDAMNRLVRATSAAECFRRRLILPLWTRAVPLDRRLNIRSV
jgi:hypothetical protein